MNISSYEIELPINKLSPYQQLYRGRHQNGQVYLLHIFPRQYLTQEMIDQISFRQKQLDFVFEKIESKEAILISYLDSAFWINLEQQIKIESLKSLYQQLYQKYSILDGNLDFDPDFIFTYDGQIFVLDYGISDFVNKKYRDFEFTTKTKTYLFGLLLLNLNCPKYMTDKIYQCKDQYQIDYYIKQEAENNHLSYDILESILKMVKLDPSQRPTFQEVGQWRQFYSKKQVKKHSSSVIDFTNTIIPSNNTTSFHSSQRAIKQQNYQAYNQQDSIHNESVRAAIQKQKRQIPISNYKCSSYDFASATMTKNLQNKKQSASNINKDNVTQQSFYQNGNGQRYSQQSVISNNKTQNYFFYQKSVLSQQKLQQPVLSRDSSKTQQVQKLEKNSPFMSDGSQIPDIIVNKPVMNHVANAQKIVKHSNNDISTRNQPNQQINNLSYLNVPNSNQTEKIYNTQIPNAQINQDNFKSPFINMSNSQLKETINIDMEEQSDYQNKQQKVLKQNKLKTPAHGQLNKKEDDKIEVLLLQDQANSNQNTIQTQQNNQQVQGKKQEFIKRPFQDYQIITQKPNLDQKDKQGNNDQYQQNAQNLEILDFQDPKFLNPSDQLNRNQDNQIQQNVKFADYIKKYFHYLSIIEYIILTVNDLNQKLMSQGKQWIVPLTLVYKRGYVIRRLLLQDVQQEKNIFDLPDFIAFKATQQYQQLQATITQQNDNVEQEFQLYLEKACSYLITMEDVSQQKLGPQLNLNIKTSTKIQTQKYLYTQLYPKIKSSLTKAQAGNLQNNQFSERDWIQSKLLCLYTILIIDLDLYQMESQNFKESTLIEYRKSKDNDLVQIHCNELEITINKLPQFNA
ncbi:unnamed protein product (macronuclear) [Paramecium tetraurelia]|uniref:Protein kinase domain-containing protein n=1 Tax=Paramecium tetraurelia TaxID=5888 RepID=A0DY71_PARTE|nr:uncharacterized protein GSPATT00002956001 [Paramecium tetraurelia]CAK87988.1 unnamed protein product [Paramecium tetraurelia]|eukprot:XP_001455385.1 hypothetical protein (macronuclear) [Paramecium tetraurelia strain d4-2]